MSGGTDAWDSYFATTGSELEIQDALLALQRVLALQELEPEVRRSVETAASALRGAQNAGKDAPGQTRPVAAPSRPAR